MVDPGQIGGIGGVGGAGPVRPQRPDAPPADAAGFRDLLANSIAEIERLQTQADTEIQGLATGEVTNVSQAMVAVERADLAFRTMMEIRNKILAAYEEINRMNI